MSATSKSHKSEYWTFRDDTLSLPSQVKLPLRLRRSVFGCRQEAVGSLWRSDPTACGALSYAHHIARPNAIQQDGDACETGQAAAHQECGEDDDGRGDLHGSEAYHLA